MPTMTKHATNNKRGTSDGWKMTNVQLRPVSSGGAEVESRASIAHERHTLSSMIDGRESEGWLTEAPLLLSLSSVAPDSIWGAVRNPVELKGKMWHQGHGPEQGLVALAAKRQAHRNACAARDSTCLRDFAWAESGRLEG